MYRTDLVSTRDGGEGCLSFIHSINYYFINNKEGARRCSPRMPRGILELNPSHRTAKQTPLKTKPSSMSDMEDVLTVVGTSQAEKQRLSTDKTRQGRFKN